MDTSVDLDSTVAHVAKTGLFCPMKNCRKHFMKAKRLLKHFRRFHPTKWMLICRHCSACATRKICVMDRHLEQNHGDETFPLVSVCHSSQKLDEAIFVDSSFSLEYSCTLCTFISNNVKDFNIHNESHSVSDSESVENTSMPEVKSEVENISVVKSDVENLSVVGSEVTSSSDLEASNVKKPRKSQKSSSLDVSMPRSGITDKSLSSDVQESNLSNSRENHKLLNFSKIGHLSLDLSVDAYSMNTSLNAVHPCPVCGKCFTRKRAIRTHMVVHTDERSFHCNLCPYKARRRGDLNIHMDKSHQKQRPHSCSICFRSFGFRTNLKRHLQTHNDEKPFKCDRCNTRFKYKSSVTKHLTRGCNWRHLS